MFANDNVRNVVTFALCACLLTLGAGSVAAVPNNAGSADAGAGYVAYEASQGDLSAEEALGGGLATGAGIVTVGKGIGVAAGGSATTAVAGTTAAGVLAGGMVLGGAAIAV